MDVALACPSPDLSLFGVEEYISEYSGHTRIKRIMWLVEKCLSPPLAYKILNMAINEVKRTTNVVLYKELVALNNKISTANNAPTSLIQLDQVWLDRIQSYTQGRIQKLEQDYYLSKLQLAQEDTRRSLIDMGMHYYECGDPEKALHYFVSPQGALQYGATFQITVEVYLRALNTALESNNVDLCSVFVEALQHIQDIPSHPLTCAKVICAAGLVCMKQQQYRQAALKFVNVDALITKNFTDVIAAQDIGLYGGLCGLASFGRSEVVVLLLQNEEFKQFLEYMPAIQDAIEDSLEGKYLLALQKLRGMRSTLKLDIYLAPIVDDILEQIMLQFMINYCRPFVTVELDRMAKVFQCEPLQLYEYITTLISSGRLQAARDNNNNNILHINCSMAFDHNSAHDNVRIKEVVSAPEAQCAEEVKCETEQMNSDLEIMM